MRKSTSGGCDEGRSGEELDAVVAGARRRAFRDGDRQIDTAHLLHTLLESDPRARAAFAGGPPQIARLLGYLAQRAIGYGVQWSGSVEDSGARRRMRPRDLRGIQGAQGGGRSGWSPAAVAAMGAATARARVRGALRAEGPDLLAALAGDPECRAVEVLRRAGVDTELLVAALDGEMRQQSTT
ncbi:peptidase [Streptomyces sp. NBS 14/10]|uniref:Clp protease N-terminal domain-containing protein n=1 Tax=Streptomyces sp. NBS 14/10 TaxID=1945643 RepID=UPI0015C61B73|nr:Clp protease N-terminal domain-containing protein [Streptomyces sp. NBS 14/10]KAK1177798.1 peptidase [Streptomyces sp. NBS 14/10]